MNEQELREKIINTIKENGVYNGKSMHRDYYVINDEELADALIEEGIGDVSELKKHRMRITKDGTIQQLYSGEEVEQIVKNATLINARYRLPRNLANCARPQATIYSKPKMNCRRKGKNEQFYL